MGAFAPFSQIVVLHKRQDHTQAILTSGVDDIVVNVPLGYASNTVSVCSKAVCHFVLERLTLAWLLKSPRVGSTD